MLRTAYQGIRCRDDDDFGRGPVLRGGVQFLDFEDICANGGIIFQPTTNTTVRSASACCHHGFLEAYTPVAESQMNGGVE